MIKRKSTKIKKSTKTTRSISRRQQVQHQKIIIGCIAALIVLFGTLFFLPRHTARRSKGTLVGVNEDVLQYQSQMEDWCREYDISQYSALLLAMMQQESSGQGTDVMQCSESPFNTMYSNEPGSIADPDYSIQIGVQTFAYCLELAGCSSISDTDRLKLAIQEYNFGNHYAEWALDSYGGYSAENAAEYSEMMKAQLGWASYGDPEYVDHVLQYFSF